MNSEDYSLLEKITKIARKNYYYNARKFDLMDYEAKMFQIMEILNCIECDKCKLWGKIQFSGLKTAMDILSRSRRILQGKELVFLYQTFYKLSSSISFIDALEQKIKYKYVYYLSLYVIEIVTVFISLAIFFILSNRNKKRMRKKLN